MAGPSGMIKEILTRAGAREMWWTFLTEEETKELKVYLLLLGAKEVKVLSNPAETRIVSGKDSTLMYIDDDPAFRGDNITKFLREVGSADYVL